MDPIIYGQVVLCILVERSFIICMKNQFLPRRTIAGVNLLDPASGLEVTVLYAQKNKQFEFIEMLPWYAVGIANLLSCLLRPVPSLP